jgi:hypothetical protein
MLGHNESGDFYRQSCIFEFGVLLAFLHLG